MSAEGHLSLQNSIEFNESLEYGTPLQTMSPLAAALRREVSADDHPNFGASISSIQRSIEEEDEEDDTDVGPLLGPRNQNNNLLSYGAVQSKKRVNWDSFKKKFKIGGRGQPQTPPTEAPRCECHPAPRRQNNKARNRLLLASTLTFVFMIAEIVGAYSGWGTMGGWVGHCATCAFYFKVY